MTNIELEEFNPHDMLENPRILIIGKRAGGKTVLCNSILDHYTNIKKIVIYDDDDFQKSMYIFNNHKCMKYEADVFNKILSEHEEERKHNPDTKIILCLDDCLHDKNIFNDTFFRQIWYNRCLGVTMILSIQFIREVSSLMENVIDYVFAFEDNNNSTKQLLFIRYFETLRPFNYFDSFFCKYARGYQSLVCVRKQRVKNVKDTIFYYSAST
jgi:hypothetical protein